VSEASLALDLPAQEGGGYLFVAWVRVRDAAAATWVDNPKQHDLGVLCESLRRYGFQELPVFDRNLPNVSGGQGAVKAGNGRVEALAAMERAREPLPAHVRLTPAGEWAVPVVFGGDAKDLLEAQAYALDSNNSTMAGGPFPVWDVARMYDQDAYREMLSTLAADEVFPVTVDGDALDALLREAGDEILEAARVAQPAEPRVRVVTCPRCGHQWEE